MFIHRLFLYCTTNPSDMFLDTLIINLGLKCYLNNTVFVIIGLIFRISSGCWNSNLISKNHSHLLKCSIYIYFTKYSIQISSLMHRFANLVLTFGFRINQ